MAPSSMILEHVWRSKQEMICFPLWNIIFVPVATSNGASYVSSLVNPPPSPREILALAEVCALWVLSS